MKLSVIHRAFEESSRLVAFVDVSDDMPVMEALEYAYHRTQNLAGSWSRESEFEFGGEIHQNPDFSEDVTVMADLPVSKRTVKLWVFVRPLWVTTFCAAAPSTP